MNYVWANADKTNCVLDFTLKIDQVCDVLKISAVDFYQVFVDEKLISFGPSRTAEGFSRISLIPIKGAKTVRIRVNYYGVETYACDFQKPFFGAEVTFDNKVIYTTNDFICTTVPEKINDVPRYSYQHGYLEVYDYNLTDKKVLSTYSVDAPVILSEEKDSCKYDVLGFEKTGQGQFTGFSQTKVPWWVKHFPASSYLVDKEFLTETENGYNFIDYVLPSEKTGFIKAKITAKERTKLFITFEEIMADGEWFFGRNNCYDFISITIDKGQTDFISLEPYSFKYLKVIYKGDVSVDLSTVLVENGDIIKDFKSCDHDLNLIYNASKECFAQNAFDVFTDCPTRERAGWLCDSFFLGKAEKYFTEKNAVEKRFLENIVVSSCPDIPEGMLPKCFPAEHKTGEYIPNWAMWFVIELNDYFIRTDDRSLVDKAKDKVYALKEFFDRYLNSDGLLEDLENWVFVDYSDSNTRPYLSGVNYPSNILYAYMLDAIDFLYGDNEMSQKANAIRKTVFNQSFNGEFFIENAVREDGKLVLLTDHITEACQYYALFMGVYNEPSFVERVKNGLGPLNSATYPFVSRSTGFVGIYLRLLWLDSIGERDMVLAEIKKYFLPMAKTTGTLWEYNSPLASCNHGFTSIVAYLIDKNYGDK